MTAGKGFSCWKTLIWSCNPHKDGSYLLTSTHALWHGHTCSHAHTHRDGGEGEREMMHIHTIIVKIIKWISLCKWNCKMVYKMHCSGFGVDRHSGKSNLKVQLPFLSRVRFIHHLVYPFELPLRERSMFLYSVSCSVCYFIRSLCWNTWLSVCEIS